MATTKVTELNDGYFRLEVDGINFENELNDYINALKEGGYEIVDVEENYDSGKAKIFFKKKGE